MNASNNNATATSEAPAPSADPQSQPAPQPAPEPASAQTATPAAASEAEAQGGAEESPGMAFTMTELPEPEVLQELGPQGLLTVLNNSLNNQMITTQVTVNIEVTNFGYQMSLNRATNMATQAFQQHVFLGGLH